MEKELTFFDRNQDRMGYSDLVDRALPIGSGPVEAACKTIVKSRFCQSGMRWSIQGGQNVMNLRVLQKSETMGGRMGGILRGRRVSGLLSTRGIKPE